MLPVASAAHKPAMTDSSGANELNTLHSPSDLNVRDLFHHEEAAYNADAGAGQHDPPAHRREHSGHIFGVQNEQKSAEEYGQGRNDVPRDGLLCGQDFDFAKEPDAVPYGVRDRVEHFRQVTSHVALDVDGGDHQVQV